MKRSLLALVAALVLWSTPAHAQITITYTFANGATADADQVNTNFSQLANAALNRTGGTITGNITVSGGVTIDGVDVGVQACTTCTPTLAGLIVTGSGAAAIDVRGGVTTGTGHDPLIDVSGKITAINATNFADLSGANLTSLNATSVSSGTLAIARGGTGADLSGQAVGAVISYFGGVLTGTTAGVSGTFLRSNGGAGVPSWVALSTSNLSDASNIAFLNAATNAFANNITVGGTAGFSGTVTFSAAPRLYGALSTNTGNAWNAGTTVPAGVMNPNSAYTIFQAVAPDGTAVYWPVWK